jgi:hypothetical protein
MRVKCEFSEECSDYNQKCTFCRNNLMTTHFVPVEIIGA